MKQAFLIYNASVNIFRDFERYFAYCIVYPGVKTESNKGKICIHQFSHLRMPCTVEPRRLEHHG